jgi:hypothetical protein
MMRTQEEEADANLGLSGVQILRQMTRLIYFNRSGPFGIGDFRSGPVFGSVGFVLFAGWSNCECFAAQCNREHRK